MAEGTDNTSLFHREELAASRLRNSPDKNYKSPSILDKVKNRFGKEKKYGFYEDRPIIGRDSRISEGVLVGANSREALVAGWNENKGYKELGKLYAKVKFELMKDNNPNRNLAALTAVFNVVDETFPNQNRSEEEISAVLISDNPGEKIEDIFDKEPKVALDNFIKFRVGVCRHTALASAVLMERLIDDGVIQGKVSLDKNTLTTSGHPDEGYGHTWTRFTDIKGQVTIVDVMFLIKTLFLKEDEL